MQDIDSQSQVQVKAMPIGRRWFGITRVIPSLGWHDKLHHNELELPRRDYQVEMADYAQLHFLTRNEFRE